MILPNKFDHLRMQTIERDECEYLTPEISAIAKLFEELVFKRPLRQTSIIQYNDSVL